MFVLLRFIFLFDFLVLGRFSEFRLQSHEGLSCSRSREDEEKPPKHRNVEEVRAKLQSQLRASLYSKSLADALRTDAGTMPNSEHGATPCGENTVQKIKAISVRPFGPFLDQSHTIFGSFLEHVWIVLDRFRIVSHGFCGETAAFVFFFSASSLS